MTISKNSSKGIKYDVIGIEAMIKGLGMSTTISTSNTRNNTARRKNRKENGMRALETGLNPHSNGLDVSRSFHWIIDLILIEKKISINAVGIRLARINGNNIVII